MLIRIVKGCLAGVCALVLTGSWPVWGQETPLVNQFPQKVFYAKGSVSTPAGLVRPGEGTARLAWPCGGAQPIVAYDFGGQTVGGYAVIKVRSFKPAGQTADGKAVGFPILRLSYATHPDGLGPKGCFTREHCAHYLGMDFDNPVLPANVNRFETYTIARTGTFVAPLLQGQQRYVRLQLDTPGTEVEIESLEIRNVGVYATDPIAGSFSCSDERLNRVWEMGARTCRIAAIPNHDAWRVVDGKLLPRKLERSGCAGFCASAGWTGDGLMESRFELAANPHDNSAFGLMFRASGEKDGVIVVASQPSVCRVLVRENGVNRTIWRTVLSDPLVDGVPYKLGARVTGNALAILFNDVKVADVTLPPAAGDRFGFYTEKEWWPVVSSVTLRDGKGTTLFHDDFSKADAEGRLPGWDYHRSFRFLADGAKRDRLVWSGDLWWAARSCLSAFRPDWPYLRESLRLLAFNQTPEGFIWAAPYGENAVPPASGCYGHFPSDEFCAWFVPVLWDYYLYTADRATAAELYPAMRKVIDYLTSHCRADGLFVQRRETSSHANRLEPGDVRHRVYMNVILWMCYRDGAKLARDLGHEDDAAKWTAAAEKLARAIRVSFWDPKAGTFRDTLEAKGLWHFGAAILMASGFVTPEEARVLGRLSPSGLAGKFLLLCVRGKFEQKFAESAYALFSSGTWFELADPAWEGAQCNTECGYLVRNDWWDESHPDTTATGVITTYLLGVEPTEPGFRRFRFRPLFVSGLTHAEGSVPTPHGFIRASWRIVGDRLTAVLEVPPETTAEVALPGRRETVGPGRRTFEISPLPKDLYADETLAGTSAGGMGEKTITAYRSNIYPTSDAAFTFVVDLGAVKNVQGADLVAGAKKLLPKYIGIDVAETLGAYGALREWTDVDWTRANGTVSMDLRTVGGSLRARYVRFTFRHVPPDWNAALKTHYRVMLDRIRVRYAE